MWYGEFLLWQVVEGEVVVVTSLYWMALQEQELGQGVQKQQEMRMVAEVFLCLTLH
jgi:hypothetical protein